MSENTYMELKAFKPHLKLHLGDVVVFKEDPEKRKMVIANFHTRNFRDHKADYICKWVSSQGKPFQKSFREKELIKIDQ